MSSILKIVIAASVANLIDFILETIGSRTPLVKLFFGLPWIKSRPQYLRSVLVLSPWFFSSWDALWRTLNFEISSVASLAALVANIFGMIVNASLN